MKISNETKIGVFAAIAITMLILGYNIMRGKNIFTRDHYYYARYKRVDGLAVPNHVRINGLNVGKVTGLKLSGDTSLDIIVVMAVDPHIQIPKGSVATIINQDFLGTKAVQIEFSKSTEYCKDGDTLLAAVRSSITDEVSAQLAPVTAKAQGLIVSLDTLTQSVNSILDKNTQLKLKQSIADLEHSMSGLDKMISANTDKLTTIFANIESITGNLNDNEAKINAAIANFANISDSLAKSNLAATIMEVRSTLTQADAVMTKINSGQGTMGLLVNDDKLYTNLQKSSLDLDALLTDLKANPSRYVSISVFGEKDKKK